MGVGLVFFFVIFYTFGFGKRVSACSFISWVATLAPVL